MYFDRVNLIITENGIFNTRGFKSLLRLNQSVYCWEKPLDYEEIRSFYSVSFCDNDLILQLLPLMIAAGKLSNHNMNGTVETKKKAYLPIPEYWCTVTEGGI